MIVQASPYPTAAAVAVPARYWRVRVPRTWQDPNPYLSIAELQMRATHGGADLTSGKPVSADNSHSSGPVANAIDDNATTLWTTVATAPAGGHWIMVDFEAPQVINEVAITSRSDGFRYDPKDLVVERSDDALTFTAAFSVNNIPGWTGGETKAFSF